LIEPAASDADLAPARLTSLRRNLVPTFPGKGIEALQPVVALLREIGEHHGKSPARVALRWLIENEHVLPIPGAKNGQQASDNAAALTFALTPAEIDALGHATQQRRS
jgi:aryl-alcohol dehydrogenase-like predicted oxidoreductase